MKKINPRLLALALFVLLAQKLNELTVGKVRHTYDIKGRPDLMLCVASDRMSIFDFILNMLVGCKGAVLTALTIEWLLNVFADVPNHLVAYGAAIDEYLPPELRNNPDLQARAIVVKRLRMLPVEFVVRGYLMGNAWKEYKKYGTVGGIQMPKGLREGDPLPEPLFTPTTKSETGHDVAITFDQMVEILKTWLAEIGSSRDPLELAKEARQMALDLYKRGQEHAKSRRVRILDTKFELGLDADGRLTLGDEVLTPDSSRFCMEERYSDDMAAGRKPSTSDKQYVRDEGAQIETLFVWEDGEKQGQPIVGIDNLDPENEAHVDFVSDLEWPQDVPANTTGIYTAIFARLSGVPLATFQANVMKIAA